MNGAVGNQTVQSENILCSHKMNGTVVKILSSHKMTRELCTGYAQGVDNSKVMHRFQSYIRVKIVHK